MIPELLFWMSSDWHFHTYVSILNDVLQCKTGGISFPVAIIPTVRIIGNWRLVKKNRWEINLFVRKALRQIQNMYHSQWVMQKEVYLVHMALHLETYDKMPKNRNSLIC
jgi:hypothetical protein